MAGTSNKRPYSESASDDHTHTKRRVRRRLQHVQNKPRDVEPASQDPVFAQGQLLRSISAVLAMAGFDSVNPTALEMFRSHVEEYMLQFLHYTRTSMCTSRRTKPTALDFTSALALMPNARTASLLQPQLGLAIPENVSCSPIPDPQPSPPEAPDLSALLHPLMSNQTPTYIPKHFPVLPPQHAWKNTPVFPHREKDARKMREKATEEGIMAEQALRKLAAAAKAGAVKVKKRKEDALAGSGKLRDAPVAKRGRPKVAASGEDIFGEMMKEVGGQEDGNDAAMDLGLDRASEFRQEGVDVGMDEAWS